MNPKLLRGSVDTIIIKLLSDNGEMYGYEITQRVKELTKDNINLTEGALYPSLHKLESKGILSVESRSIGNRYRKYYKITKSGKKQLTSMLEDMHAYISSMQLLMNPKTI